MTGGTIPAARDARPWTFSRRFFPPKQTMRRHLFQKKNPLHLAPWRLALAATVAVALPAFGDYREDIGYTRLQSELGAQTPRGTGVGVTQVEAPETRPTIGVGNYLPDTANTDFSGKSITPMSGAAGASGHATGVASIYYGLASSIAPGVASIDVYEVNSWLGTGFLRRGNVIAPKVETRAIQNHSWIGSIDNGGSTDIEVLRRFDFAVQRDGFLATLGLNNSSQSTVPVLMGNAYNGLTVGLSNGGHSTGTTTVDGSGRVRPEIVAPFDQTSFATPSVAAAGALLLEKARSLPALANATTSLPLKAMLLAGATKTKFTGWSRTTTRPLDAHFGAGELNIYRTYQILTAGERDASGNTVLPARGWDLGTTAIGGRFYFFEIAPGNTASGFSAVLTWNRQIAWPSQAPTLADLSLRLYTVTGFTPGGLVDSSVSPVDNLEHIYQPNLSPGRYALEVSSTQSSVSYALAWDSRSTISVAATTPTASEQAGEPGVFTITRAGDLTSALPISYTVEGTATPGTDYQSLAGSVTIPAGVASAAVNVSPVSDGIADNNETVVLRLTPDLAFSVGPASSATITITEPPYASWQARYFPSTESNDPLLSGELADPDQDGVVNLVEYALALNPRASDVGGPTTAGIQPDGRLSITYTRNRAATDVTVKVEVSTDLVTWITGPEFVAAIATTDGPGSDVETITAVSLISPASEPRQFLRLAIQR